MARRLARVTSGPLRWARRQGVFRSAGVVALIVLFLGWWRWDSIGKALIPGLARDQPRAGPRLDRPADAPEAMIR
jgi:hypothetical protein